MRCVSCEIGSDAWLRITHTIGKALATPLIAGWTYPAYPYHAPRTIVLSWKLRDSGKRMVHC